MGSVWFRPIACECNTIYVEGGQDQVTRSDLVRFIQLSCDEACGIQPTFMLLFLNTLKKLIHIERVELVVVDPVEMLETFELQEQDFLENVVDPFDRQRGELSGPRDTIKAKWSMEKVGLSWDPIAPSRERLWDDCCLSNPSPLIFA